MDGNIRKQLEDFVEKHYSSDACGYTALRSFGNCDDCFEDRYDCGISKAARMIGEILGMDLSEPEEDDDGYDF